MTDESEQRTRLPARRPPDQPVPADRFTAPPSAHRFGLSAERAAKIVRQSSNARWYGFLTVTAVVLFVILYYIYEVGIPGVLPTSRLNNEEKAQAITTVENGYNVYQANCARCHGTNGQGGIGPVLNDQMKLFSHLNEQYLKNVLTVGGRYVCGNSKSVMPVWLNTNGGPLNYLQVEDVIAFIRAPTTGVYMVRDPETRQPILDRQTGQPKTFRGWVDPSYKPPAGSTPFPDCWTDQFKTPTPSGSASPAPSGSVTPSGSPGPSPSGSPGPTPTGSVAPTSSPVALKLVALGLAFDLKELSALAGQAFSITLDNQDAGIFHDVDIRRENGEVVFNGEVFAGVGTKTYEIPPLEPGTYTFICSVHLIPAMTGTLTVQ